MTESQALKKINLKETSRYNNNHCNRHLYLNYTEHWKEKMITDYIHINIQIHIYRL